MFHPTAELLPYWYTAAVLLVDDDEGYLDALASLLSAERKVYTATSHREALALLDRSKALSRNFIRRSTDQSTAPHEHMVTIDASRVTSLAQEPRRYEEIALVVADYSMPDGDGLSLCRSMLEFPCRRILLTGAADERLAVDAFNERLIHHFMRKADRLTEQLQHAVAVQQHAYFRELTRPLAEGLRQRLGAFEHEPPVAAAVLELFAAAGATEYYLCTEPGGYLVRTSPGEWRFLLVQSGEERESTLEILQTMPRFETLARQHAQGDSLVYLSDPSRLPRAGGYEGFVVPPLRTVPAGDQTYRLAWVDAPGHMTPHIARGGRA
jgi:CheY-like chemotaxis protein